METPNIKVYLIISGLLIVLFLIVTFVPFGRKTTTNSQQNTIPTPTLVEVESQPPQNIEPTIASADFTGASEKNAPPEVINASLQKQDLRGKTPFDTGLFKIEFDYNEDKFIVTLSEPKAENRSQFDQWLKSNYPSLSSNQFNFK